MHQLSLFDTPPTLRPTDPSVAPDDVPRLTGQCARLLAMLQRGPVRNTEMMACGMFKYTSRISDLRRYGYRIVCEPQGGGLSLYRLEEQ